MRLPVSTGEGPFKAAAARCHLRFDHFCDQGVLVAHELHHFRGGRGSFAPRRLARPT
jgi:hypothetical protein